MRSPQHSQELGISSVYQEVNLCTVAPRPAGPPRPPPKTFALRMERQNAPMRRRSPNSLAAHPRVVAVHYPGLPTHPNHDVARRQMRGFGGVVSFEVAGDLAAASRVVDACRIPRIAPSLGGVESLIEQPALMSFYELTTEERLMVGIKDNLIRYSVGIEDGADLIADLPAALETA